MSSVEREKAGELLLAWENLLRNLTMPDSWRQVSATLFDIPRLAADPLREGNRLPMPENLTPRETQALRWTLDGKSSKETAQILGISSRTVEKHLQSIYTKVGANSRADFCREKEHGQNRSGIASCHQLLEFLPQERKETDACKHFTELVFRIERYTGLSGVGDITVSEIRIAGQMLKGHTYREIAEKLQRSPRTVEKQAASLLLRLGLERRIQFEAAFFGFRKNT